MQFLRLFNVKTFFFLLLQNRFPNIFFQQLCACMHIMEKTADTFSSASVSSSPFRRHFCQDDVLVDININIVKSISASLLPWWRLGRHAILVSYSGKLNRMYRLLFQQNFGYLFKGKTSYQYASTTRLDNV